MKTRKAHARWNGTLKEGKGVLKLHSVDQEFAYNFSSRFEEGTGTNPEELIGAAHAGCFSMALSALLAEKGFDPKSIATEAEITLKQEGGGFKISKSNLKLNAEIPNIGKDEFLKIAGEAKENCPVSQALSALEITLEANLKN